MIKNLFVVLHVITAAGWFGLALTFGSIARRVAAGATPGTGTGIVDEGTKMVRMMNAFIVLTFVFGLLAFLLGGGFSIYGPRFHTSLLLILILVVIQFVMITGPWKKVTLAAEDAGAARKRIAAGIGIGHLVWLIVLVLMLWGRFPLA